MAADFTFGATDVVVTFAVDDLRAPYFEGRHEAVRPFKVAYGVYVSYRSIGPNSFVVSAVRDVASGEFRADVRFAQGMDQDAPWVTVSQDVASNTVSLSIPVAALNEHLAAGAMSPIDEAAVDQITFHTTRASRLGETGESSETADQTGPMNLSIGR